jgi:hypothetical protein
MRVNYPKRGSKPRLSQITTTRQYKMSKTEKLDKAYTEASQALRDGGIAMTKLLDLYKSGELPFIDFLEFMDAMDSTVQAKTIQGIKHD